MAVVSIEEQRSYLKNKYLRGKSSKEIHENLCEACENNAPSFKTVYRWLARFSAGKTDMSDEATDSYHIKKVKEVRRIAARWVPHFDA